MALIENESTSCDLVNSALVVSDDGNVALDVAATEVADVSPRQDTEVERDEAVVELKDNDINLRSETTDRITISQATSTNVPVPESTSVPDSTSTTTPIIIEHDRVTSSTTETRVFGPIQRPLNFASPYIEDYEVLPPGPNIFSNNVKNAFESRTKDTGPPTTALEKEGTNEAAVSSPLPSSAVSEPAVKTTTTTTSTDVNDDGKTSQPEINILVLESQPQEAVTETEDAEVEIVTAEETVVDDRKLAAAKEWHDSITKRVRRLQGLSTWLGERNKRMDGMVEILVRSLEHMGVGAVADNVGNLIPLQNFRLNTAIKLSQVNNTWVTCDDDPLSNDINAWLPCSPPDDHDASLTMEQIRKCESQIEVLRREHDSLQRSLQDAVDNQASLGSQVNQWQACIDSTGQQLHHVTKEIHESKSRERHLRHLLGEERRIKDSLIQQNRAIAAVQQERTSQNVIAWQQGVEVVDQQQQVAGNPAVVDNAQQLQQGFIPNQQVVNQGIVFGNPASVVAPQHPVTGQQHPTNGQQQMAPSGYVTEERPWQHKRVSSFGPRGGWNRSASPFRPASSAPSNGPSFGRARYGNNYHYKKQHSTNANINRMLNGFFDNLNRIESALKQQGINIPGPVAEVAGQVPAQAQGGQQVLPTTPQAVMQQQQQLNQPIYYTPAQPIVYADPSAIQPVQPTEQAQVQVQQPVVQVFQPQVQFEQVEGEAY